MLRELIRSWRVDCPAWARQLGLVYEHAAIASRHRRMRGSWVPHLTASRATILEAAGRCARCDRVLIVGAGDCLDVPVEELAARFTTVILADVVVSPAARKLARRFPSRVRCVVWDATGALAGLAAIKESVRAADARRIFEDADPGAPPGGEPDLVVSANCLSQLGLVPGHSLQAATKDGSLPDRCGAAAAKRHLAWLAQRTSAVRVVVSDTARLDVASDGRLLKRENLHARLALRPPDRSWRWDLALMPEHSPDYHRFHEIGAWIDGP